MKEGEIVVVENLEELLPGRLFESLVVLAEIEAQDPAGSVAGSDD